MHIAFKHAIVSNLNPLGFKYTSIRVRTWRWSRYGSLQARKSFKGAKSSNAHWLVFNSASKCDNLVYVSLSLSLCFYFSLPPSLLFSLKSLLTHRSIGSPIFFCPGHAFVNFLQFFCKLTIDSSRSVTHLTDLRVPGSLAKF